MVKLIKAEFNGAEIQFNDSGFFNATTAAKRFNKRVSDWLELPSTRDHIDRLVADGVESPIVTKRGRAGGTWLHPKMAVVFSLWLGGAEFLSDMVNKFIQADQIIRALNDFDVPEELKDMYVYAIREKDTGNIKLGISRDPEMRLRQLQTANSSELELIAYRKARDRFKDEWRLHFINAGRRIRGEWFSGDAHFA